ncbi:sodium channel protein Nach-like [Choristoneura fumiferana]|uniref:sodium channel protein Nach-like n=1 Tax=Choristoneura fumiferana TaxID=7141 RepID=UPI003D159103
MRKNVMKGKFKTLLKNFCLESTYPGLKYFYLYPDCISRGFWAVSLLLLYVFAGWLAVLLYSRFSNGPTRISIKTQHAPLTELPYPAITVCSPNQMTIAAVNHLNKTLVNGNRNIDLNENIPHLLGFHERIKYNQINASTLQHLQGLINANRYTVREIMALVAQSCDDFLKLCIFQQERQDCRKLFRPLITVHGLCCIFNSPYYFNEKRNVKDHVFEPHMATTLGRADALTVVVDYEPEKAMDYTVGAGGGIRVYFTDWSEFPADDMNKIVYPNTESFMMIRATHTYCTDYVMELDPNSRNCTLENELDLIYFDKYRNSDCDHLCYVRNLQSECHCLPLFLPQAKTDQVCNITDIPCIGRVRLQNFTVECNCLRDCVYNQYFVHMSLGNLHALPYMLLNPYESVNFTNSTSILHMYFSGPSFVKKKQETVMTKVTLFSNIGGIFGLCLGFSIISIFEIIFYISKAIRNHFTR